MLSCPPIYLLRHGQTDWNASRRIQGQRESDLTEQGQGEARRQGEILGRLNVSAGSHAYFCSPLRRTRQTADLALAGLGVTPVLDDRLKEIFMGDWEGYYASEVAERWPDTYTAIPTVLERCLQAPGGEGWDSAVGRAEDFLASLTGPSVVVSHGAIGMILRGLLRGLDRTAMGALQADQGVVLKLVDGQERCHR